MTKRVNSSTRNMSIHIRKVLAVKILVTQKEEKSSMIQVASFSCNHSQCQGTRMMKKMKMVIYVYTVNSSLLLISHENNFKITAFTFDYGFLTSTSTREDNVCHLRM
mmetsp:Transcript_14379/g.16732  ORF Transcript_14379/g.16732 Transcript_14379/m.16732 type:complete len:107 (+) Transcript_14379:141-461(+)